MKKKRFSSLAIHFLFSVMCHVPESRYTTSISAPTSFRDWGVECQNRYLEVSLADERAPTNSLHRSVCNCYVTRTSHSPSFQWRRRRFHAQGQGSGLEWGCGRGVSGWNWCRRQRRACIAERTRRRPTPEQTQQTIVIRLRFQLQTLYHVIQQTDKKLCWRFSVSFGVRRKIIQIYFLHSLYEVVSPHTVPSVSIDFCTNIQFFIHYTRAK